MYAHVPKVMKHFILKIEKLSHIMGTASILEMARAYDRRPRLWLLTGLNLGDVFCLPIIYHIPDS